MILVDTSIWIDHISKSDRELSRLLSIRYILTHPFITGEIAMGNPAKRRDLFEFLGRFPEAKVASHTEVMQFIERSRLYGAGIGFIDAHLLVAAKINPGALLWTRDKRLLAIAIRLGLEYIPQ